LDFEKKVKNVKKRT